MSKVNNWMKLQDVQTSLKLTEVAFIVAILLNPGGTDSHYEATLYAVHYKLPLRLQ